jgi:ABC-2 type transport system permease protein
MKKYLQISKINFLNNIQYFGEFIFKSLFILIILFIFTNLWQVIYSSKQTIEGFTLAMMIWYLLMTESIFTSTWSIVKEINQDVQSGEIAYKLNKPYNYVFYYFFKSISHSLTGFALTFTLGGILVYILVGGINFNLIFSPLILFSAVLAIILDIFILISIGLTAFWVEDNNSFKWVYDKIIFTIGGMLLPLEVFPKWISGTLQYLPFSFVSYFPAKIFVNFNIGEFIFVSLFQILYILFFIGLALIIFKIGSRRININGG